LQLTWQCFSYGGYGQSNGNHGEAPADVGASLFETVGHSVLCWLCWVWWGGPIAAAKFATAVAIEGSSGMDEAVPIS
jgi:hypothetical protein